MQKIERRVWTTSIEVRAETDSPTILGYAAVFNSRSQVMWGFVEQIMPGAFADSIGGDVRALWNHDTSRVLGRTKSGTLRLKEDEIGLMSEIDPPTSAVAEVEAIRRGDVDQMSFGFETLEDKWDIDETGLHVRTIIKAKLYEVSPVTFPAYTATTVAVRHLPRATSGDGFFSDTLGFIPDVPGGGRALTANNDDAAQVLLSARARVDVARRKLNLRER